MNVSSPLLVVLCPQHLISTCYLLLWWCKRMLQSKHLTHFYFTNKTKRLFFCPRFGRSYNPEPSAAELRDALQRPIRRGNSFLRFGRSQPLTLTTDDLYSLLRNYEEEYETPSKKSASFIRFGRDPSFIRLGRSGDDDRGNEQGSELMVSGYPQRTSRARDHFIRLGRDNEELEKNDFDEEENRRKRSAETCHDCQS
ncbi:unnamed protein product [Diatraea saccharalis]|uniref:FMRFamide-related peptides n=1 Tax=Diatraea saccharalis TaxID=40085 RepID=A0A9N9N4C2_9NEOP|nr:unnamed protein product [Diatraea saccharalis]